MLADKSIVILWQMHNLLARRVCVPRSTKRDIVGMRHCRTQIVRIANSVEPVTDSKTLKN